jgi:hypothetical protein
MLAVWGTPRGFPLAPKGRRYIVLAASDQTVTSLAGANRLLRTEPQVQLLWRFVLHSLNDYLGDLCRGLAPRPVRTPETVVPPSQRTSTSTSNDNMVQQSNIHCSCGLPELPHELDIRSAARDPQVDGCGGNYLQIDFEVRQG